MDNTLHMTRTDLQSYIKEVFGAGYIVSNVTQMQGGAQKVVYKVDCDNGFTCVLYVWDLALNYFQKEIENEDLHSRSYGGDLFEQNNKLLTEIGIPTPALYDLNRERSRYPFDYALVEYVEGKKLDAYINQTDKEANYELFQQVGNMVGKMHANERDIFGKVNEIRNDIKQCHELQMQKSKADLRYISQYIDNFKINHNKLLEKLQELESRITYRNRYGFTHGELGPDHFIVNNKLVPYVIDIEGAEFFDIEYEHSFLRIRFGDHYHFFDNDTLDPYRMLFYQYYHHISLTAGFLKLLHRGFPNQQFAESVIKHQSENALSFIKG